jgi:hypothetical protein
MSALSGPAAPVPFDTMCARVHRSFPRFRVRRDGRARLVTTLGSVGLALVATACKSDGANPRVPLEVPNAVSGGTRGGGRPEAPSLERRNEALRALAESLG